MNKRLIVVASIVLIAIIVIAAVSYYFLTKSGTSESLLIGVPSDFSGATYAIASRDFYDALQLAAKEINDAGGILGKQVEFIKIDTENDAAKAISAVTTLIVRDKVDAIMSACAAAPPHPEIDAVRTVGLETGKTPIFFETADPALFINNYVVPRGIEDYWFYWDGLQPHQRVMTQAIYAFLNTTNVANRTIAMISNDSEFCTLNAQEMRDHAAENGWTIVLDEVLPLGDHSQWGTELSKVRTLKVGILLDIDFMVGNGISLVSQFLQNPPESLLYVTWAPSDPSFMDALGSQANGVLWNMGGPSGYENLSAATEFRAKFNQTYGRDSRGMFGPAGYDTLYMYKQAVELAGTTDPESVAAVMTQVTRHGVWGFYKFDPATHIVMDGPGYIENSMLQVQNEDPTIVIFPSSMANGAYIKPPWMP